MIKVTSSNIKGYEYNKESKVFTIYFLNESIYTYENVDPINIELFTVAESKGKYFNENIKNQYKATKIKDAIKKEKVPKK